MLLVVLVVQRGVPSHGLPSSQSLGSERGWKLGSVSATAISKSLVAALGGGGRATRSKQDLEARLAVLEGGEQPLLRGRWSGVPQPHNHALLASQHQKEHLTVLA